MTGSHDPKRCCVVLSCHHPWLHRGSIDACRSCVAAEQQRLKAARFVLPLCTFSYRYGRLRYTLQPYPKVLFEIQRLLQIPPGCSVDLYDDPTDRRIGTLMMRSFSWIGATPKTWKWPCQLIANFGFDAKPTAACPRLRCETSASLLWKASCSSITNIQ